MFDMMLAVSAIVLFAFFAIFIWREKDGDERENLHRALAGRFAYLTGAGVLVLGIVIQLLRHQLDYWLVWALLIMVLAKIVGIVYTRFKK